MDVAIIVVPIIHNLSVDAQGQGIVNCDVSQALHPLVESGLLEKLKQSVATHLPAAIEAVRNKPLALASKVSSGPAKDRRLTPRENEVLLLTAKGLTQKETARALGISPATVGGYKKEIYRKLEVSSVAEATVEAVKSGIILP